MTEEYNIMKGFKFNDIVFSDDMRKFTCWGSVEVKDRHGEIIPAEEIYKIMDIWMDRGAPIMYQHTNRNIGKGLSWRPEMKNGKPGVLITGKIFNHYKEDEEVWKGIKEGKYEGLSIGGKSYTRDVDDEGNTILRNLIGYEFSLVERCGNQEATFEQINTLAKGEENMVKEEIKKTEPSTEEVEKVDEAQPSEEAPSHDDAMQALADAIASINERLDMIEEKIAGGDSEEEPVEEQKEEEEEAEEEEKEEEEEDKEDEVSKIKKELEELKKSLKPSKVVKAELPEEKEVKKADVEAELNKALEEMSKSGRINFAELGAKIRELKKQELEAKFK
jgi:hypothetical protein